MTKPLVFNYKRYEELRDAYKQLLADNQKLTADNRELRDKLTNMEIKLRVFEEDRPKGYRDGATTSLYSDHVNGKITERRKK